MFEMVSVGGATQDVFVRAEGAQVIRMGNLKHQEAWMGFEYGAKVPVEKIRFTVGGGATNTAVSFANLGLKTACCVQVGDDAAGEEVRKELQAFGVNDSLVLQRPGQTGYSVILTSYEGERTVLAYRGLNSQMQAQDFPWENVLQTQWLYISSLSGDSHHLLLPLVEKARAAGVKVAWNPGGTQLKKGLETLTPILASVDLLFINRDEAELLTGVETIRPLPEHLRQGPEHPVRPPYMYDLEAQFLRLKALCKGTVIITDGKRGTQAYDGNTLFLMPVFPVAVADVLGAGDAFGSGFTAGWLRTASISTALIWGAANAAGVVTDPGAHNGLKKPNEIDVLQKIHPQVQVSTYTLAP